MNQSLLFYCLVDIFARTCTHTRQLYSSLGEVSKKNKKVQTTALSCVSTGGLHKSVTHFKVSLASSGSHGRALSWKSAHVCVSDNDSTGSRRRSMCGTHEAQFRAPSILMHDPHPCLHPLPFSPSLPRAAIRERSQPIRASVTVK